MSDRGTTAGQKIQVRRYPNRRYYNSTHSQHVTLEAIYALILEGHDVQVTDSKTGEDITAKVLTQIILEHESPKLDVFPVSLLHRLIRTNEPLVREFVEKYFSQAFSAFVESQRQLSDYLRDSMGLGSAPATPWPQAMWNPFTPGAASEAPTDGADAEEGAAEADEPNGGGGDNAGDSGGDSAGDNAQRQTNDLRQTVEELQEQVQRLQQKLDNE